MPPQKKSWPNDYQDNNSVPATDGQWMTFFQADRRPEFPYGRDYEPTGVAGSAILNAMAYPGEDYSKPVDRLSDLSRFLHGGDFRGGALAAARAQGYPAPAAQAAPSTGSYLKAMDAAYPWKLPPASVNWWASSAYKPRSKEIALGADALDVVPSYPAAYRHEVDHALASHPPGRTIEVAADRRREADIVSGNIFGDEIPPSLADAVWLARDHLKVAGKPLDHPFEFPNGVPANLGTMASQAEQHGMFRRDGPSMAQLLATPSGQAYMRRIGGPGDALLRELEQRKQESGWFPDLNW